MNIKRISWKRIGLTTILFGGGVLSVPLILWLSNLPAQTWQSLRIPVIYFSVFVLGILCYLLATVIVWRPPERFR